MSPAIVSMNRRAELQRGAARRAPKAPTWRSALQARGSWSQCASELAWWLPMNRGSVTQVANLPPACSPDRYRRLLIGEARLSDLPANRQAGGGQALEQSNGKRVVEVCGKQSEIFLLPKFRK